MNPRVRQKKPIPASIPSPSQVQNGGCSGCFESGGQQTFLAHVGAKSNFQIVNGLRSTQNVGGGMLFWED